MKAHTAHSMIDLAGISLWNSVDPDQRAHRNKKKT